MKNLRSFKKLMAIGSVLAVTFGLSILTTSLVSANPACYQYDPSGNFTTSTTPVFNNICGYTEQISSTDGPVTIGNESDFVRIRPNTSGSDTSNANNPALRNTVAAACTTGQKFDVWTYIHNDAMSQDNNNGSGSAVAHDVKLALSASNLGTTTGANGGQYNFSSTVSASNAESVTDGATLDCNGHQVKLTLVPSSVHYTTNLTNPTYGNIADSAVNGTTPIGNPVWGSGDQWGCYDYRVVVVYQVVATEVTPPAPAPVVATCDKFTITPTDKRSIKVNEFTYSATNTSVKDVLLDWGDGSAVTPYTPAQILAATHTYAADKQYLPNVTVEYNTDANGNAVANSGGAGSACAAAITFNSTTPPVVTPPIGPAKPTPQPVPTTLVNTGPGSVAGMFAGVSAIGAVGYRWFLGRRLTR